MASLKLLHSRAARALADIGVGLSLVVGWVLAVALLGGVLYVMINGPTWAQLAIGIPALVTLLGITGRSYRNGGF